MILTIRILIASRSYHAMLTACVLVFFCSLENTIGHTWVRHPLPCDGVAVHLSTDAIGRPWVTTSEGEVYLRRGVTAQVCLCADDAAGSFMIKYLFSQCAVSLYLFSADAVIHLPK